MVSSFTCLWLSFLHTLCKPASLKAKSQSGIQETEQLFLSSEKTKIFSLESTLFNQQFNTKFLPNQWIFPKVMIFRKQLLVFKVHSPTDEIVLSLRKKFFCTTSPFGKSIDLPTSRNSTLTPKASVKHIKRKPNRPDTLLFFLWFLGCSFSFFTLPVYVWFRNNSTIMYENGFSIYVEPYGKIMYTWKVDAWANYRVDFWSWMVVLSE